MISTRFVVISLGLLVASCETDYARAPLTEKSYQAAAKHCHSDNVLRLRRGTLQIVYVSGLLNNRSAAPHIAQIECVRQFLGVAEDDVIIYR